MDHPYASCFTDPEHSSMIEFQIGCSVHYRELDDNGVCRVCTYESMNGCLCEPPPLDLASTGLDPANIFFGVIGSIGAIASVVSAAVVVRETARRQQPSQRNDTELARAGNGEDSTNIAEESASAMNDVGQITETSNGSVQTEHETS
jgi:hypothetical protein